MQMFDADPKFPHSGILEGNVIHYPGAFDECLRADAGDFRGKYCLMTLYTAENDQERDLDLRVARPGRMVEGFPEWLFSPNFIKFATCIPSTCTNYDAMFGMNNFLNKTSQAIGGNDTNLLTYPMGCQSEDEEVPLTSGGFWQCLCSSWQWVS